MCTLFHTRTGARWILQYHHNYTLSFQNQTLWPLLNHSPSSSWQPEKGMVRFGLKLAVYLRWITTIKWGLCPHFASQVHWFTKLSGAFSLWSRIKYAFALDSVVFTAKPFCKKLPRKIMISRDSWAVKMAPIQKKIHYYFSANSYQLLINISEQLCSLFSGERNLSSFVVHCSFRDLVRTWRANLNYLQSFVRIQAAIYKEAVSKRNKSSNKNFKEEYIA